MANFGQLLAGAGRVSQGMEQARAVRQANEASAQTLQQNRMRLEELRRMEEARARISQLPSTVGDISFSPAGYQGMPTYKVPEQLQEIDTSTIPARIPMGGDTNVDVSVADQQFYTNGRPQMGFSAADEAVLQSMQAGLKAPPSAATGLEQKTRDLIDQALESGAFTGDLEVILRNNPKALEYYNSRVQTPTQASIPYGQEFDQPTAPTPTAPVATSGTMTREKFLSLTPEVQQQYLQREADIRGFGSIPAFIADAVVGMPAEYLARGVESLAESRLGRAIGMTQPGEDVSYGARTFSPFQERLYRDTPVTIEDYVASLPSEADLATATPPAKQPTPPAKQPTAPAKQPAVAKEEEDIPAPVAVGLDVGTKKDPIQTVAKGRPRLFEADPNRYAPYLEQGMRNRQYLRQVANIYRQSGIPDKAFEIEAKIQGLDVDLYKMATDQAINEFRRGGDPARMIGLLQQFGSVPIDVQYRTDGNYNVYVNGTMLEQPLDAVSLTDELRTLVDDVYRQQKTDAQLANQKSILEAQLETDKEIMKQNAQMIREAAIAQITGIYNLAKEQLTQRGYIITNLNDGRVVISAKDGSQVGLVDLNDNVVVIDGQEIPSVSNGATIPVPIRGRYGKSWPVVSKPHATEHGV